MFYVVLLVLLDEKEKLCSVIFCIVAYIYYNNVCKIVEESMKELLLILDDKINFLLGCCANNFHS